MLVTGKRQYLEGRIAFYVHETVAGEVHCLQFALSQEGFLIGFTDVVSESIQLYKSPVGPSGMSCSGTQCCCWKSRDSARTD
jgi:hypothetical protein